MLGAIAGDIIGSHYEKRNHRSKNFDPLFHPQSRFTDDTVCLIAIADTLLGNKPPAQTLQDWCLRHEDVGGWGQRFSLWIGEPTPRPYGSHGNGGAMRIAAAAWLARDLTSLAQTVDAVTTISHDHPEGLKGAQAIAMGIWMALHGASAVDIGLQIRHTFAYDLSQSVDEIRRTYTHSEAAARTVPQAIACALQAHDYEDAIRNAVSLGGDSDTLASMAGAIAEARFGMPHHIARTAWSFLPAHMQDVVLSLYRQGALTTPESTAVPMIALLTQGSHHA